MLEVDWRHGKTSTLSKHLATLGDYEINDQRLRNVHVRENSLQSVTNVNSKWVYYGTVIFAYEQIL